MQKNESIASIIPTRNRIQIEKNEFSDGMERSGRDNRASSMDLSSGDYEYSNYNSSVNDQNALLQKRYKEILAKRFPKSKSEEMTALQTPARNLTRSKNKKKYSFHIPAHLKSKSKEFLSQNRDGSKYNLEVLSNGKYSVKENQSYSNITKRRLINSLKGKLSPPSGRVQNPRHEGKGSNEREAKRKSSNGRSDSLPDISRESTHPVSKNPSRSQLSKMHKIVNKHFESNKDLNINKSYEESSYGRSTRNSYSKNHINSRQILERLQKRKHHNSFGPV